MLKLSLPFAALFLLFVAGSACAGRLPFGILFLYLGASVVAFPVYWFDKSAARQNRWRTSERVMQMLGLLGGWPGALVAQQLLRHKTRKASFQMMFWGMVLLNCSGLAWFWTAAG